jgi:phenylalanyl-tRNA synthetase alpha subunit
LERRQAGLVKFYVSSNSEASSLFPTAVERDLYCVQVPAMSLDQILEAAGASRIALVKVDIEGAEIDVLLRSHEATLRCFDQISVEFHDFAMASISGANVEEVKARLQALGFDSVSFSRRNTDVLFLNRRASLITRLELQWLRHFVRNWRGAGRVARRWLVGTQLGMCRR